MPSQRGAGSLREWTQQLGQDTRWEGALLVCRQIQAARLRPNTIVLNAALGLCARSTAWMAAVAMAEQICTMSLQASAISLGTCVNAIAKAEDLRGASWTRAVGFLSTTRGFWNVEPGVVCWNSCLASFAPATAWRQAALLCTRLRPGGFQPDSISGNAAANCVGRWQATVQLLPWMHSVSSKVNVVTYNTVLKACEGPHAKTARALWDGLRLNSLEPDVRTVNAAIGASHDDWRRVLWTLWCWGTGTAVTVGATMKALSAGNLWEWGMRSLVWMSRRSAPMSSVAIVEACRVVRDTSQAEKIVESLICKLRAQGAELSREAANAVLGLSSWPRALSRFRGQIHLGLMPSCASFNTVATAMAGAAAWLLGLGLLMEQRSSALRRDLVGLGSFLNGISQAALWEMASSLFADLRRLTLRAEVLNHNVMLSSLRTSGLWQKAFRMLAPHPFSPDAVTFGAALSVYLVSSTWQQAAKSLESAACCGVRPDKGCIEASAAACARRGRWRRALHIGGGCFPDGMSKGPWHLALSWMQVGVQFRLASREVVTSSAEASIRSRRWQQALRAAEAMEFDPALAALAVKACEVGSETARLHSILRDLERSQHSLDADLPAPLFPMYTVPEIEPHEVLMSQGALVEFHQDLGKAAFVSHQWVGVDHPDPECRQLRVLQDAFKSLLSEVDFVPLEIFTESLVPSAKPLETAQFREKPLFIWYDYFSCPQLKQSLQQSWSLGSHHQPDLLSKAIDSIPAYIARTSFFFVLCPVVGSASQSSVFTIHTWAERGWCRVEKACRELSMDASWIVIRSATKMELIATPAASANFGAPGEGAFTVPEDRLKLGPVLLKALQRRLLQHLKQQDLIGYRVLLNLQPVHLRGFLVEPVGDLVPGFEASRPDLDPTALSVEKFLFQNGFAAVDEKDSRGWYPLHYAALSGKVELLRGLLAFGADLNLATKKDQVEAGVPMWTSALAICVMFRHNQAARLLVDAKAKLEGGIQPAIHQAAIANNADGIRILCEAGCSPHLKDMLGFTPVEAGCGRGSTEAFEELLTQASGSIDISRCLYLAMVCGGGKPELVHRLVEERADVNYKYKIRYFGINGLYCAYNAALYRSGKKTIGTTAGYHGHEQTPLMAAVMTGQYEGAAALLAAGARLDLRNYRKWTAADFSRGHSLPRFLLEALEGQTTEAERITADAVASSFFEI
ncbi:unnamed protein product [Symbiodinium sp. CCMP2592]|nr:unnamed protein product [Symbiodinium sp. CCMP2592]